MIRTPKRGGGDVTKTKRSVRITAVPPGEASLWVREKWVGLELPLTGWMSPGKFLGFGVLSGPRTCLSQLWAIFRGRADRFYGFPVEADSAVDILEVSSPAAAAWWRENAPQLILPKRYLLFHAEVCQIVGD
jgi:hypothetical protein